MNGLTKQKLVFGMVGYVALVLFSGCRTIPGTVVSDNGGGATAVRDDLSNIGNQQTELAITGEQVANSSTEIEQGVNDLASSIESGAGNNAGFEEILREVRKRPLD